MASATLTAPANAAALDAIARVLALSDLLSQALTCALNVDEDAIAALCEYDYPEFPEVESEAEALLDSLEFLRQAVGRSGLHSYVPPSVGNRAERIRQRLSRRGGAA